MSQYTEKARALRNRTDVHCNCAQSVLLTFAPALGLTEEQAFGLCANFGGGMKMGSVCGAVTGALMVLGLAGLRDKADLTAFLAAFRAETGDLLECRDLLRGNSDRGGAKKPFCDGLVLRSVGITEGLLRDRGVIE